MRLLKTHLIVKSQQNRIDLVTRPVFDQFDPTTPNNKARILIDSIALVPRLNDLDILQDEEDPRAVAMKEALEDNDCREHFLSGKRDAELPEECDSALKSLSMYVFEGGFQKPCMCHGTGSVSSTCDPYSGQCECKNNVVGRTCGGCAPGLHTNSIFFCSLLKI